MLLDRSRRLQQNLSSTLNNPFGYGPELLGDSMHLDSYPHITKRIESLWGTQECRTFLLELISDSRDGQRQGLPPEVAKEIILVLQNHDEHYPGFDDSAEFVKMTYQFMPREVPVAAAANEGTVLKFLARISAYGVAVALAIEALRRIA